jgi:hypothetical protein
MHCGCGRRTNGIPGLCRLAEVADLLGTTDRFPRLIAAAMGCALAGARKKATRRRSGTLSTAWKTIMILAAMMSVVPLTWGFGLERARGIERS